MSDDTTQTNATTVDATTATDDTQSSGSVPSFRLKEEAERRREAEQRAEKLEQQLAETKMQTATEVAKARYGEEVINSEKVQQVLTKYPNMDYSDAITLAGLGQQKQEPAQEEVSTGGQMFVGRPATPDTTPKEMTIEQERAEVEKALRE